MLRSREQQAGMLYEIGMQAVRTGGHELHMLAGHLNLMIHGTQDYKGPLWRVRIMPDGQEYRIDHFVDYLCEPPRKGLGLPSLYFLHRVLQATPKDGERAISLVRAELAKEGVDFDSEAKRDELKLLSARPPAEKHGGDRRSEQAQENQGGHSTLNPSEKNTAKHWLARLKRDHPKLARRVVAGELSANAAAIEAGFRKPPATPFETIVKLLPKLTRDERRKLQRLLVKQTD
jgi:hypothetical protein